ncbi:hypothetical protein INT45_007486, partial [Circinella minor]
MTDTIATTTTSSNNKEISNDSSTIRSKKRLQKSTSLQPSMKNNNNDMELAAEIGQGLLSEVRKMQSLLHQKEDTLMTLEHEKLEQEHQIDSLAKQLKQKTDREDQMNEEIWNLELAKQELMQHVQDLSRDLSKSLVEQNKLVQQERLSLTELDQLHSQQLLWNEKTEEYEQEIVSLRRTITQLRREIKNLEQKHKQVTLLKENHDITKSNCSDMEEEEEKNGDQDQLPVPQQQQQEQPISPQVDTYTLQKSIESATSKNDQYALDKLRLEISTLQDSLNHAHEIISVLEHDLKHERGDQQEIRQLLQEAQETIEILQEKHTEDDNDNNKEEQEEEQEEERITRPPQREMSLGDELVNAANVNDNDNKEEHGEQEERITRPPQREMSPGDELVNVANDKDNDNKEEEQQQEERIAQLSQQEMSLDDKLADAVNDNEEVEQQQEERITRPPQREMPLDDKLGDVANDNDSDNDNKEEEQQKEQEERIAQLPQREMSLDDKHIDVANDNDNEEEEQQQEERITKPSQREMSLGDELVNAPNTSWEIISLEPITNHISPTFSPETTSSLFEQSQNNNYKSMIMRKRSNKNYGTCVVRSGVYVDNNTPDDGGNKDNSNDIKQKREDQALISPARASAFDFDPTFVKNQQDDDNKDNSNLISSDSRATLTTNLVPAVTRTMIGDWMYKYTRKVVGSGISEKKHKRFFWIHPYTRTLYWGSQEPGVKHANGNKSALIISFQAIADNINPPSIMIQTPRRSLKVRCFDIMAHRAWVKALNYLVSDSEPSTITTKDNCAIEPSGSLSMLFQPRFRSSLCMPFSQQPAARRSVA